MNYQLDTSTVVAVLRNQPPAVRGRLRDALLSHDPVAVSSIALFELWYGVARSERRPENTERLRVFLSGNIGIVPFEEEDAEIAGDLRASLDAAGTPIGPYDLLIAAQAIRSRATLITVNVSEFGRVRDLSFQNWVDP